MTDMTTYLKNKLVDTALGVSAYAGPGTAWIGLSTTATTSAGAYTEPTSGDYARIACAFTTAAAGLGSNTSAQSWTATTSAFNTVTHFFIADASTAGNVLLHGALTASKIVGVGDTITFAATSIGIQFN